MGCLREIVEGIVAMVEKEWPRDPAHGAQLRQQLEGELVSSEGSLSLFVAQQPLPIRLKSTRVHGQVASLCHHHRDVLTLLTQGGFDLVL